MENVSGGTVRVVKIPRKLGKNHYPEEVYHLEEKTVK